MIEQERKNANAQGLFRLWLTWVISVGLLMFGIFLSPIVSERALPIIFIVFELSLFTLIRLNRESSHPVCFRIPFIISRVFMWSALIMIAINFYYTKIKNVQALPDHIVNEENMYITILIVAPLVTIISLWSMYKGYKLSFCQDCHIRNGVPAERGFLGSLFTQEGPYMTRLLLGIFSLLTIVEWGYYFMYYINVNLNAPDMFFYTWMPILFYVFSVVYLGLRYIGFWMYYNKNIAENDSHNNGYSILRYLIVCDDYIYLSSDESNIIDTKCKIEIPYRKNLMEYDKNYYFNQMTGLKNSDIRELYNNPYYNADCNIFHYICYVEDREIMENSKIKGGDWYNIMQINQLIGKRRINKSLAAEINRIYTITMAWKSYDRQGNRLYNIKNYKPTFRIRDLKDWDVDYNDIRWLYVALNNEDQPFFKLKRFWRKYVSRVGEQ